MQVCRKPGIMTQPSEMFESALVPRGEELDEEAATLGAYSQETIWENPTDRDIILDLHVGSQVPPKGVKPTRRQQTGIRQILIKAHSKASISNEFDIAIQHVQCHEHECAGNPMHCRKQGHRKQIVGGLGIHLKNLGEQRRPLLHPSLDDKRAEYEKKQILVEQAEIAKVRAEEATKLAKEELERINAEITAARTRVVESSAQREFVAAPSKKG
jgi:hypothetical protein